MYNELIIKTNSHKYKVFLQDGYYSSISPAQTLHNHKYAEVHVLANGDASFRVEKKVYHLKSGNMMIVPGGAFHHCNPLHESTLHAAFQIDYSLSQSYLMQTVLIL